jgi:ABC-type multidrug transport system permease subunit
MLAMFFNPLGFDALFKMVMDWTGSYWITDVIFYGIALLFLGLYFLVNKKPNK